MSYQFELRERLSSQEKEVIEADLTKSRERVSAKLGIARSSLELKSED